MSPRLHSTYLRITHRQNSGVFPPRLPHLIRQPNKRHHRGRPRTRRGSLTPNSNLIYNTGRQSIHRHPNTLSHFLQRYCESSNSSYPKGTATLTCRRASNRLYRTFSEGDKSQPTYNTTEGHHCTRNPYTLQSLIQTCGHHPSPIYKDDDPSTNTCHN